MPTPKTKEQRQKLANLLAEGVPVSEAMVQAGWSENSARKGKSRIPASVVKLMPANRKALIEMGKTTGADDMRALVHGRLIENVTQGKDTGSYSAKVLGSSRDLNMWQAEIQNGVVVLQMPNSALSAQGTGINPDLLKEPGDV